jgi:hypothetical protein
MVSDMRGGTSSLQSFAALRLCARFSRNIATSKLALRACVIQATTRESYQPETAQEPSCSRLFIGVLEGLMSNHVGDFAASVAQKNR